METKDPINTAIDIAKTAKAVLPQTTEETDGAISTLIGWFNNVVLFPIKKANITYQYKLECFKDDLYNQIDKIPEQYIREPDITIAGPTLESLKYIFDEQALREMYVKLLASSVDSRKNSIVHPSYVEIIKRMNSYDAKLFKYLASCRGYIRTINPNIGIKGTNKIFIDTMPEWYIVWEDDNIFQTSASLVRLSKLGVIELMYDRTAGDEGYEMLENSDALKTILKQYQSKNMDKELEIITTKSILYVNDYGKQFATACL